MSSAAHLVDWDLAGRTARKLARPGPEVAPEHARAAVHELRDCADRAERHVVDLTGLSPSADPAPVRVVDRGAWIDVNCRGMATVLDPIVAKLQEKMSAPGKAASAIGARTTGVQAGAVLAFVSSRVLGQYDVFGTSGGQLLLVAPNVVEAEQRLGVEPGDFRLWVCLHEVTHRLQFTAVPWLREYMLEQIERFVDATDLDPGVLADRLRTGLREAVRAVRAAGGGSTSGNGSDAAVPGGTDEELTGILALIDDPRQREVLDRMTAVMSLLEGHAEYVMDEVGPGVVPTVATIRKRFTRRRQGQGPVDRMLRRLLGLDAKMRQYADGRRFVGGVVKRVGMTGFNAVWREPDTLPRKSELTDPAAWVARVHGSSAVTA